MTQPDTPNLQVKTIIQYSSPPAVLGVWGHANGATRVGAIATELGSLRCDEPILLRRHPHPALPWSLGFLADRSLYAHLNKYG
jgi:hypothetical protein